MTDAAFQSLSLGTILGPRWIDQFESSGKTRPRPTAWRSSRKQRAALQVCFREEVDLRLIGSEVVQVSAPLECFHQLARALWHLDGTCCMFDLACEVAQRWQQFQAFGVQWGVGASGDLALLPCGGRRQANSRYAWLELYVPPSIRFGEQDWHFICEVSEERADRRYNFVETWFLSEARHPVCIRSRRFLFTTDMTPDIFKKHCAHLWVDHLTPDVPWTLCWLHRNPTGFALPCFMC